MVDAAEGVAHDAGVVARVLGQQLLQDDGPVSAAHVGAPVALQRRPVLDPRDVGTGVAWSMKLNCINKPKFKSLPLNLHGKDARKD